MTVKELKEVLNRYPEYAEIRIAEDSTEKVSENLYVEYSRCNTKVYIATKELIPEADIKEFEE